MFGHFCGLDNVHFLCSDVITRGLASVDLSGAQWPCVMLVFCETVLCSTGEHGGLAVNARPARGFQGEDRNR